ncbi:periphilin-1 isoform X2 [Hippoglossus hippoglossus]|uniref:periphilin-1 isoform X2 n=1 Tax=Hippoglossus hippoglossus TaxID=8267 RepID=UPI00148D6C86|nr:periphilin-1 isoform X2 [Hippoglossus hippoglossus]XP_035016070.1 periphilin-1 isoform X2 [Hippoglossus stenolepis]
MDHARAQDAHQSKGEARPIRRVQSPTRPRAWSSNSYKPKFGGKFYKPRFPRDDHSFYKPGFVNKRQYHLNQRDHFQPKPHHSAQREREKETGRYEWRENADGSSCPKQSKISRPFLPRSVSSRDKDTQFTVCLNDRSHSKKSDHTGSESKEKEQSRDRELPLTASQTPTRDRAIQQKRREIDEVYYRECQMFGLVTKMLIEKEPSLEHLIQSSLQENLRDIGKRCVDAMEKFIEEYDSREPLH